MSNLIVQKQMSGLRIKMVTEPEEIEVHLEYNPLLSLNVTLVEKLRRIYLIKLVVNDFFYTSSSSSCRCCGGHNIHYCLYLLLLFSNIRVGHMTT